MRFPRVVGGVLLGAALLCVAAGGAPLSVSPDGHYFTWEGKTRLLVGDSGTQCVLQNLNVDYLAWLDDLSARGINAAHVWAFVPPRQHRDGSRVEGRYGYVYPGATPWARGEGSPAADQGPPYDLRTFDEGDDPGRHWWPRLRDLAQQARARGMVLGVTLFFGWPKHEEDWVYHPLNRRNGGHLEDRHGTVVIETPGEEVLERTWDDGWPEARKTQWVWERYADKLVRELAPLGNVFFVYKDERSYDTGAWQDNMTGHLVDFLHRRGAAVVVDWEPSRQQVDAVMVDTGSGDKYRVAAEAFARDPARPVVLLEGTPYTLGDPGVRRSMWTFAMGGGHFIFHDDERQGTVTTGVMGYDPRVAGGVKPLLTYDWLGHLSRLFNEHVADVGVLRPAAARVLEGKAYCLADEAGETVVAYLPEGASVRLRLGAETGTVRWYDPRRGAFEGAAADGEGRFSAPDDNDWVLLVQR